jgi:hypothetical protein
MKIRVCDVHKKEGKLRTAKYRCGFRGGERLDLCEEHQNFTRENFKTNEQLIQWLYTGA